MLTLAGSPSAKPQLPCACLRSGSPTLPPALAAPSLAWLQGRRQPAARRHSLSRRNSSHRQRERQRVRAQHRAHHPQHLLQAGLTAGAVRTHCACPRPLQPSSCSRSSPPGPPCSPWRAYVRTRSPLGACHTGKRKRLACKGLHNWRMASEQQAWQEERRNLPQTRRDLACCNKPASCAHRRMHLTSFEGDGAPLSFQHTRTFEARSTWAYTQPTPRTKFKLVMCARQPEVGGPCVPTCVHERTSRFLLAHGLRCAFCSCIFTGVVLYGLHLVRLMWASAGVPQHHAAAHAHGSPCRGLQAPALVPEAHQTGGV